MDWTGEIIGLLHCKRITQRELATEVNLTPEYINSMLNGKRPCDAGKRAEIRAALNRIVARREEERNVESNNSTAKAHKRDTRTN